MKNFKLAVWIFVMLILQTIICQYIKIGGIYPNMVFAFVIAVCIMEESFMATVTMSVICGVLLDALVSSGIGMYTILFSFSAVLCHEAVQRFLKPALPVAMLCAAICFFIGNLIYMLLGFASYIGSGLGQIILFLIIPSTVYTSLLLLVIYPLLKRFVYRNENEGKRGGMYGGK